MSDSYIYDDDINHEFLTNNKEKNRKSSLVFSENFTTQNELDQDQNSNNSIEIEVEKKSNSFSTILSLINSMVGTIVLLIPINFLSAGIFSSIIVMIIVGYISYKTCSYIVQAMQKGDKDLAYIVLRILGKTQFKILCYSSSLLMFTVGVVYFILMVQTFYRILCFIFAYSNFNNYQENLSTIDFSQFSIQWLSIIFFILFYWTFYIKNIGFIVSLSKYGSSSSYIYIVFLIYIFFNNIHIGNIEKNKSEINYFTPNIAIIIGNFAMAFLIHTAVPQIMSTNNKPQNNGRDLKIAYISVLFIYLCIGIFGSLGILGREEYGDGIYIYDFFGQKDVSSLIIQLSYMFHLVTVFPIFNFVSKNQFFFPIYAQNIVPNKYMHLYNFVFGITCLTLSIFVLDLNYIIGVCSTLFGFYIIYVVPVQFKIYLIKNKNNQELNQENSSRRQSQQFIFKGSESNFESEYGSSMIEKKQQIQVKNGTDNISIFDEQKKQEYIDQELLSQSNIKLEKQLTCLQKFKESIQIPILIIISICGVGFMIINFLVTINVIKQKNDL